MANKILKSKIVYKIYQDKILKGIANTENEALGELHKLSPFSWDYSFKYGGWKIKKSKIYKPSNYRNL